MLDVELTEAGRDDPVFGHLPEAFPTLQWHSDSFDLPAPSRALEQVRGPGALDDLLEAFEAHREEMTGHARTLFSSWLELFE